jgi:NAD(P)-dependent dehydrogenase (short-subunit alcohol dehydrogenase family)
LGRSHAKLFAARGAKVVVNDPGAAFNGDGHDRGPAEQVVEEIRQAGGTAVANFDSVAEEAGANAMVAQAIAQFGRIDVVVNNAGNFVSRHPFDESTNEIFNRMWQVHILGSVNVTRAAWPHMKKQSYGRIVNTTSSAGIFGSCGLIEYGTVKAAIHGLTKTLSLEAMPFGIHVNAVMPGALTRPVLEVFDEIPDIFSSGAMAPELVSPAVAWLAHEQCPFNGEMLHAMSGTTTRIRIAETAGCFSRTPSIESIAAATNEIMGETVSSQSALVFTVEAEARLGELMNRYANHQDL